MTCPKCCSSMRVDDVDHRQEWERITYFCELCNAERLRLVSFKTQSSMVESDEWDKEYGNENENCLVDAS